MCTTENCGVVELSLLYTESDGRMIVTIHSIRDLLLAVDHSSSKSPDISDFLKLVNT